MSRWIDAEWLKQNFNSVFWSQVTKTIDSAPSIEIVRCRECKHWQNNHLCKKWSIYGTIETLEDGFCYMGERKEP